MKNKVIEILKELSQIHVKTDEPEEIWVISSSDHDDTFKEAATRIDAEYSGGESKEYPFKCNKCGFEFTSDDLAATYLTCTQPFSQRTSGICGGAIELNYPAVAQPDRIIAMKWWNNISTDMKMMWTGQHYPGQSHNLLTASEIAKMFKGRESEGVNEEDIQIDAATFARSHELHNEDGVFELLTDGYMGCYYAHVYQKQIHSSLKFAHITEGKIETEAKRWYGKTDDFSMSDRKIQFGRSAFIKGAKWYRDQFRPEINEEEITDILTKYSTTKLSWIKSAHGKNQLVIDPMDYHKIAKALSKELKPVSEERIEELTREWYARHILAPKPEEFSFRAGFKAALKELNNE